MSWQGRSSPALVVRRRSRSLAIGVVTQLGTHDWRDRAALPSPSTLWFGKRSVNEAGHHTPSWLTDSSNPRDVGRECEVTCEVWDLANLVNRSAMSRTTK